MFTTATETPRTPTPASTVRGVLHVINGEHYSGAERVQDLVAEHLPEEGFEVGFACVKPDRFPLVRRSTVPLFETPMRCRVDIRPAWRIAELARRHGYELLHAHTPRSLLVAASAARLARIPLVYHVHSPTARDSTDRFRNALNAFNERWALRKAARLVAVSQSLGNHMRSGGFDPNLIAVVPNGVPVPTRQRDASPPGVEWTIGTVALFRPRKGLEVLLRSLGILRRDGFPVRLRAIGPFESSEYERAIHALVAEEQLNAAVDWTGFTEDVPGELAQLDAFALPSLFGEGLPMVVLEAMAAGVPVIGTRVEGIPEAIEDGVSGLLADAGDPESLAAQIERLMRGHVDWSSIRENARQRHRDLFSAEAMCAGLAAEYRTLLCV